MQRQCLGSAGGVLLLFGAAACGVPRPYSTPRTTPAGRISHSVAVEASDAAFGKQNEDELVAPEGWLGPGTYTLRVGVFERWEAAASVGTLLLAGEVKFNFLRSRFVDAAAAPRVQYYQPLFDDAELTTLSLPVLWGINVTRRVTFIAVPTLAYAYSRGLVTYDAETDTNEPAENEQGAVAALATDVSLRCTPGFAIQPGFTLFRALSRDDYRWQIGLGFNFGALPTMDR